jgi:predicted RNA-binding Zn-ribbon protein involved in translation (DUF1610 family)
MKGYTGEWECARCGCEWELDDDDDEPEKQEEEPFTGRFEAHVMPCPNCGTQVYRPVNRDRY